MHGTIGLDNTAIILLLVSSLLVLGLFLYIANIRNKSQIQFIFMCTSGLQFIWCVAVLSEYIFITNPVYILFEYTTYIGICFVPITLLLTGLIFAKTKISFGYRHYLLFLIPVITQVVIWTDYHTHMFYTEFSFNNKIAYGWYFYIHVSYSYICIIIGLYYLLYFSIKNSGFFSKQSLLIIIGTIVPLVINILYTLRIGITSPAATPVSFSFSVLCFAFSILKFNFLNISPIALQTIVDRISDSFVVINENGIIIDFNQTFVSMFSSVLHVRRNDRMTDVLNGSISANIDLDKLLSYINESKESRTSKSFEKHIVLGSFDKYFTVEITPIINHEKHLGSIILLKDITQSKKDFEIIKEKQMMLMERERLASLGQLIGGIAHNLKTPIMSIAGGIEALKDLAKEYDISVGDSTVTEADHHEIAADMQEWLSKMKPYCSYMSDIISTVKGQAVQMNDSSSISFTLDEVVKRMDLLMKHELKRYHCLLNFNFCVDMNTELHGEVNNLVQVFDNIIINAIYAYEGENGIINFKIDRDGDNIIFSFKDHGKGIPKSIQGRLFKEMVTTKGKNGTGLGLFMSYSTIKGKFGGNMWFVSEENEGTTFYVSIPCLAVSALQEVSQ